MFDFYLRTHSRASTACFRVLFAVAVSTMMFMGGNALQAQEKETQVKVIPINAKFRDVSTENLSGEARRKAIRLNSEARKTRNAARDAARDGISSGNMVPVKEYFNGYIFPQMTQPEELKESGSLRDSFFRTFMKSDVNEASRKKVITDVILPAMQSIARGKDYAPSARLNAIALLGRLDESPLVRNGTRVRPPRPSSAAFTFLSSQLGDATSPPWIKAAAIQGLIRHLRVDQGVGGRLLNDGQRDILETFAINTIDGKTAGQAEWSTDLDYWLKRRSVQLLGAIGRQGAGGRSLDRLIAIAGDEKQSAWMQLDAIKALRTIDFTGAQEAKVSEVLVTVTNYLQRQLANEAENIAGLLEDLIYKNILYGDTDFVASGTRYAKNVAKAASGGMGMGMDADAMSEMMGDMGMGTMGGKPEEPVFLVELPNYQLNLVRRRMKIFAFSANDVLQNATGLEAAASAKDKQLRLAIGTFAKDFLKDSSIGLVDLSKEDDDEEEEQQKVSFTDQLQEVCENGASKLKTILTRHAGGGLPADGLGSPDKPATSLPF